MTFFAGVVCHCLRYCCHDTQTRLSSDGQVSWDVSSWVHAHCNSNSSVVEEIKPLKIEQNSPDYVLNLLFSQNGEPPPSTGVTGGGDSLLSPPSVASLLDISLPGPPEEALVPGEPQTHISDSIIELAINSAHYGVCLFLYPTC